MGLRVGEKADIDDDVDGDEEDDEEEGVEEEEDDFWFFLADLALPFDSFVFDCLPPPIPTIMFPLTVAAAATAAAAAAAELA